MKQKPRPGSPSRLVLVSTPLTIAALLASCSAVKKTLQTEHRVFIRVPGPLPPAGKPISANGWNFRHVVQGPSAKSPEAQWYLAWHDDGRSGRLGGSILSAPWRKARELAPDLADASLLAFNAYPQLIEPGLVFREGFGEKATFNKPPGSPRDKLPEVEIASGPSSSWPSGPRLADGTLDPVWHLGDRHSQLAKARQRVRNLPGQPEKDIRIGILDTGFDSRHLALPVRLVDEKEGDAILTLRPENDVCDAGCLQRMSTPGQTLDSGHGTGTLGILAGRKVRLVDHERGSVREQVVEIGAAPDAEIVAARVAPFVASLGTANLAHAIDYASRVKGCDVLSISHGGSPSMMWADAVNAAYDRGTAMFAATGDYLPLPVPGRIHRTGIIVPSSTVYPAAFRRVIGVAGVTAEETPYALTDWPRWRANAWNPLKWFGIRGSYGADGVRRSYFDGSPRDERGKTDVVMTRRFNELRANPVSAYSPGIPWLVASSDPDAGESRSVDLDGGGTSAATPQAAAAAAHWLAYHRRDIESAGAWNDWRKAEAAYLAMTLTARRPWSKVLRREDQEPDTCFGAGFLKADDMLDISFQEALAIRGETLRAPYDGPAKDGPAVNDKKTGTPRDYFDGDRSFYKAVISGDRSSRTGSHLAKLARFKGEEEHVIKDPSRRQEALGNLYFNMLLVEQYQKGHSPLAGNEGTPPGELLGCLILNCPNGDQLTTKATRLARSGMSGSSGNRPRFPRGHHR